VTGDRFRRSESGRWIRREPGELSGGGGAYVWAVSGSDGSPGFTGYVPACGWCWLGAPHTVLEHDRRVGGAA